MTRCSQARALGTRQINLQFTYMTSCVRVSLDGCQRVPFQYSHRLPQRGQLVSIAAEFSDQRQFFSWPLQLAILFAKILAPNRFRTASLGSIQTASYTQSTLLYNYDIYGCCKQYLTCFPPYFQLNAGTPGGIQYVSELDDHCYWGNEVKLYEHQVDTLFAMFWHKESDIKYYVCTINKTYAKPGQRMYFQVNYTEENLLDYFDPNNDTLMVKLADGHLLAECRIMLGTGKRATITTNWSEFRSRANIREGDVSVHFVSGSLQSAASFSLCTASRCTICSNIL